jgi:UDP-glucose 4-epimerase
MQRIQMGATEIANMNVISNWPSLTLKCRYGRGFSVLELLDTVKRISVVGFPVVNVGRRAASTARSSCLPA